MPERWLAVLIQRSSSPKRRSVRLARARLVSETSRFSASKDQPSSARIISAERPITSDPDFLFRLAVDFSLTQRKVSTRMLQNRLGIGYHSTVLLIARLEGETIIGPPDQYGDHEVLLG
jgi:DNA segregation ATPase FtsK/SpoIIIE-like protein